MTGEIVGKELTYGLMSNVREMVLCTKDTLKMNDLLDTGHKSGVLSSTP